MLRQGRWTYRVRVPDELRAIIGKGEIWKSFGAVSHAEAKRLSHIEAVRVDGLFHERRAELGRRGNKVEASHSASQEQIYRAVRDYFHQLEKCRWRPEPA